MNFINSKSLIFDMKAYFFFGDICPLDITFNEDLHLTINALYSCCDIEVYSSISSSIEQSTLVLPASSFLFFAYDLHF